MCVCLAHKVHGKEVFTCLGHCSLPLLVEGNCQSGGYFTEFYGNYYSFNATLLSEFCSCLMPKPCLLTRPANSLQMGIDGHSRSTHQEASL